MKTLFLLLTLGLTVSALQNGRTKQGKRQGKTAERFNDRKWSFVCNYDSDGALPRGSRIPCRWIDVTRGNYETAIYNSDNIDQHNPKNGHNKGKKTQKQENYIIHSSYLALGDPAPKQRETRLKSPKEPKNSKPDPNKTETTQGNPCDPNPCPKDAKGKAVKCQVNPKENTYKCKIPKNTCVVDGELLARNKKRVIGCKSCVCRLPNIEEPVCSSICKSWNPALIPSACKLITPPGKCCQELDCSGSGAANAVSTKKTTPSIVTSTAAPKNPCEPNPCPKDAKGNPVECEVRPIEGTYKCKIPKGNCSTSTATTTEPTTTTAVPTTTTATTTTTTTVRTTTLKEPTTKTSEATTATMKPTKAATVPTTTTANPTTKVIPTTTLAPLNPCEPNPCPKDAHGQPIACQTKPADGTHECIKPTDMCMVDDELLARAERRIIGCKNCICLNPSANFAFCESTCKPWTSDQIPPGCQLITPPGKCCQELDCSGAAVTNTVPTKTVPVTTTQILTNPCEPNPCPKDAKGQPVACQVKPADGKHECLKPDDMCMVDDELLARAERRVIGCKNCICLNPSANFAFCESTCKPWTPDQIPPGCKLVTPPGKCCQELDCSAVAAVSLGK
ncbi:mucin-5AC-like [Lingula anatina]|uniref:Mucin-5AC-like n=1 Tax=Lingula anatina TaxID=7574 RepID=A0A1S3H6F7_LINAN|nr:mucin-5AC-like [Lingula anatina]|eukprot:XP_013381578.1 mucin-5AC-like [Lingula anatina]